MDNLPKTMKAVVIDRSGGPEVLVLREVPVPSIAADEVLIAVHAAGVGPWDADIRDGWSPSGKPRFPLILGTDGAGTVAAVGSLVRGLAIGDEVWSYSFDNPKGGFYAEYVAVVAERVAHLPRVLDLLHAGGTATTGLTALQGIDDTLHVAAEESVVVVGASGGVGTLAVQFAKRRGARVLAVASGEDGVALALKLGADVAVDGRRGDVGAAARVLAPNGVDVVFACVGGPPVDQALAAARPGARLAWPNGVEPEPKPPPGVEGRAYDAVSGAATLQRLNQAAEESRLDVPIAATFPLAEAARAHQRLAAGHVVGKVVLVVR